MTVKHPQRTEQRGGAVPLVRRRPRGATLAGLRVGQIVALQVAAAALTAGMFLQDAFLTVGYAVAAVILVSSLARWRGRWLYEWAPSLFRFRSGRSAVRSTDSELSPALLGLIPALAVRPAVVKDAEHLGIVSDGIGWAMLVAVRAEAILPATAAPARLPVAALMGLLDGESGGLSSVQVLVRTTHAPVDGGGSRCGDSYVQLGGGDVPASQSAFVVLRLDPRDAAGLPAGGLDGADRLLRRYANRAVALLADAGLVSRVLDSSEAREAMTACLGEGEGHGGGQSTRRRWRSWYGPTRVHRSFALRRWSAKDSVDALLAELATLPVSASVVALTATVDGSGEGERFLSGTVRTVEYRDTRSPGTASIRQAAARAGFALSILDGAQVAGIAATLPLGRGRVADAAPYDYVLPAGDVPFLNVSLRNAGVVLGVGSDGRPEVAQLFRSPPTRVTLVGDLVTAWLVAFRALAVGADVSVLTPRPGHWEPLRRAVADSRSPLRVFLPGTEVPPAATETSPSLVIHDSAADPVNLTAVGPWQCGLAVMDSLAPWSMPLLSTSDLVLVRRATVDTAELIAAAIGLSETAAQTLLRAPADTVTVATPAGVRLVALAGTAVERSLFSR